MVDISKYIIVEDKPQFNLSIKLVIPSGCSMRCPFCFNNLNRGTATHEKNVFLKRFIQSLMTIVNTARSVNPNRSISLDITGNEPTEDVDFFINIIDNIREIRGHFNSVVVTSNGKGMFICEELCNKMKDVVDIVNLSVHHYDFTLRFNAFGKPRDFMNIDSYYMKINHRLNSIGIKTTAVSVLYKKLDEPFENFIVKFVEWCKVIGFSDLRLRSNFYAIDNFFVDYLNSTTFVGKINITAGLTSKKFEVYGFSVLMLMGVTSLIPYVVGVEAVVDDDGLSYIDYGKEYPFIDDYVKHVYVQFP